MTGPTPPETGLAGGPDAVTGRSAPRAVVVGLLALVAIGSVADLAATAQQSDVRTLIARAQQGEVRTVQLLPGGDRSGFYLRIGRDDGGDGPPSVAWTEASGLRFEADLPDAVTTGTPDLTILPPFAPDDADPPGAEPRGPDRSRADAPVDLVATVRLAAGDAAEPRVLPPGALVRERVADLSLLSLVVLLIVLVCGPQPRRATKWGWVWLALLPYGVGQAALLLRDAPWSLQAVARAEPADRFDRPPGRLTGGRAFVIALLAGVAVSAVVQLVLPASFTEPGPYVEVLQDGTRRPVG